jgi:tripartite-type tricarboxylate transporter receptor subunit TctC
MKPSNALLLSLLVVATLALTDGSNAQDYPSRPVTIVVPFAAGGPTDVVARLVAEPMRAALGQPVIIENVTGAAGTVGTGRVARSSPDGYTLVAGFWGTHVLNGVLYPLQYDVLNDFAPIALLASNPQLIVSRNAVPAKDLRELIGWLRANPNKASQGTAGMGSPAHVGGALFQIMTGTQFQFVPYSRGAAPAMQDLIAGQIDLMFDQASNSLPHVRSGKIKAFAVTAGMRLESASDIPTVDEAGLPGFYVSVWVGMWAPRGTPPSVIARLNSAVSRALADQKVRERFADLGQQMPAAALQTPQGFGSFHKAEIEKWWPIIKAANMKGE